jgi:hypothetical protein
MPDKSQLSKFHLMAVTWEDAHNDQNEFKPDEVKRNFHKAIVTTNYGLCIQNDDDGITLTSEEDEHGDLRHVFFIPRKMIVEVVDFGVPKRPRKPRAKITPTPSPA